MKPSGRTVAIFFVGLIPAILLYAFLFAPLDVVEGLTLGMGVFAWAICLLSLKTLPGGKHVGAIGYLSLAPAAGFSALLMALSLLLAVIDQIFAVPPSGALVAYVVVLAAFFLVYSTLSAANAHSMRNDEAETKAVRTLKDAVFEVEEVAAQAPQELQNDLRRLRTAIAAAPVDATGAAHAEDGALREVIAQMRQAAPDAAALRELLPRAQSLLKRRAHALQAAAR